MWKAKRQSGEQKRRALPRERRGFMAVEHHRQQGRSALQAGCGRGCACFHARRRHAWLQKRVHRRRLRNGFPHAAQSPPITAAALSSSVGSITARPPETAGHVHHHRAHHRALDHHHADHRLHETGVGQAAPPSTAAQRCETRSGISSSSTSQRAQVRAASRIRDTLAVLRSLPPTLRSCRQPVASERPRPHGGSKSGAARTCPPPEGDRTPFPRAGARRFHSGSRPS